MNINVIGDKIWEKTRDTISLGLELTSKGLKEAAFQWARNVSLSSEGKSRLKTNM
jgi:hypothetical protein